MRIISSEIQSETSSIARMRMYDYRRLFKDKRVPVLCSSVPTRSLGESRGELSTKTDDYDASGGVKRR